MMRSTILYRRLWYVRKRNAGRVHLFSKLIVILVILTAVASFTDQRLMPYLAEDAREKTEAFMTAAVNDLIREKYSHMFFDDLTIVERDANGNIVLIQRNTYKQIEFEANVDNALNYAFGQNRYSYAEARLGAVMGDKLSGFGPLIKVKIHLCSKPTSELTFKIHTDENNRTVQKIYLRCGMKIAIDAPLNYKIIEVFTNVLLSESTLAGQE
ncbi:MAG TPA: sporulation protein YunB [Clostridia bacterium]|nr:sporulation protein YunB [Clostridia bacterium]